MSSSHHYPLIPRLLFLLAGAFILGGQAGKLHSWQKSQAASASLLSESTSWGLSFQKEGERPVGNATINDLGKYHAYYAEDTNEKKIYLTFDAGYENGNTPRILDALKKHQAPATFFVVGNFISDNPDLIRRMVSEGHTVGNHTMTHPDMSGISSKDDFQKQLDGVEKLYESVTGEQNDKILPSTAGNLQYHKPGHGPRTGIFHLFLEPCICRLDSGSAAFQGRSLSKASRAHSSRCHCPSAQYFLYKWPDPG